MLLKRCYVYDLDGVLIDSRDAVRRAYAAVGCEMPDDAWGKPWIKWCDIETHSRKVRVYQQMILDGEVPTLPPLELVQAQLFAGDDVHILTGAAHEAVRLFMKRLGLERANLLGWSCSLREKAELMRRLTPVHVTYVDDDNTKIIVPHGGLFVHYTGQTIEQLKEDMKYGYADLGSR